ncbi:hypothetical protein BS78_K040100 [Paspalum vaginatum]|uniref:Uncharacterized protein n=1 Tax=Paspalum vaginatum TaxID=158149 RepID=A0A9W7X779_9POAL|nr:hypothetical protein BS78_K040100 [Paspalum vaginatum]
MASCLALSAVLAAGAGPRRFAGGRLPTPTAVSHGAVLLAGRGHVVGLSRPLAPAVTTTLLPVVASRSSSSWRIRAATPASGGARANKDDDEDCELVKTVKIMVEVGLALPLDPTCVELPDALDQVFFGDLGDRSLDLWVHVTNRLRPSPDTKLYEGLHRCGCLCAATKIRKGDISWECAARLGLGLDLLRRVVSSMYQAPLPLIWDSRAVVPTQYRDKMDFSAILQRTYEMAVDDIQCMLPPARARG